MSQGETELLMREIDSSGDGEISYEEVSSPQHGGARVCLYAVLGAADETKLAASSIAAAWAVLPIMCRSP